MSFSRMQASPPVGAHECVFCGRQTVNTISGLTPEQNKQLEDYLDSFKSGYHTGHPPIHALHLPPVHACKKCIKVYEVMNS